MLQSPIPQPTMIHMFTALGMLGDIILLATILVTIPGPLLLATALKDQDNQGTSAFEFEPASIDNLYTTRQPGPGCSALIINLALIPHFRYGLLMDCV